MTDNTQPEALDLADWLEAVGGGPSAKRCAALLREQNARIAKLEAQLSSSGFTAADMATASAQGFRDGVASLAASAGSEPVANDRPSLEAVFRGLSDRAYCNYIEQMRRNECLGWEHKVKHGTFGEAELKAHTLAGRLLGRHHAFAEAANALRGSDAPLTHPSPPEGMVGGWRQPLIARALDEWHEDDGPVMWWAWCGRDWAGEPAWCGTPLSSDWPGYHTHWTAHPSMPLPPPPTTSAGSGKGE